MVLATQDHGPRIFWLITATVAFAGASTYALLLHFATASERRRTLFRRSAYGLLAWGVLSLVRAATL